MQVEPTKATEGSRIVAPRIRAPPQRNREACESDAGLMTAQLDITISYEVRFIFERGELNIEGETQIGSPADSRTQAAAGDKEH